ncbi:MAG: adenylate/guanylate cyclase domain-containing protein [Reyranella sp.]|uniref:adenylate/guanylate cyclase domain-containing protein n=1 Tax=Reyranella sp. TaxID=1929291 RepID=UPI003D0BDF08
MKSFRWSVPFSITILALMALILAPLAAALLWLGWRSVSFVERLSGDQRVTVLEQAIERFVSNGLRGVVSVGQTLAETPVFRIDRGPEADDERRRQLAASLTHHPLVGAAYVAFRDGRFLYVGRRETYWDVPRLPFEDQKPDAVQVLTIEGSGSERRETWWYQEPDGSRTKKRVQPTDYDPLSRRWYIDTMRAGKAVLTPPYRFVQSDRFGISVGVPLAEDEGVIGFDFTLHALSQLLTAYKITENAVIMVGNSLSNVVVQSQPCAAGVQGCLPGDAQAREVLQRTIRETIEEDRRIDRVIDIDGNAYRLIAHRMAPGFGQQFVVAAAVPRMELFAASRSLIERAAIAAAITVALAVVAALVASWLVSRSIARIAAKTERIRNLDFSDRLPVRSHITEVARLSDSVERMRQGLEVFGRYVSKHLVQQVMRSPESSGVGGVRREVTVMFTDIESFSLLSETMEPEILTGRLSRYFDVLGTAISANRGMIDKYIGDSIMAFWNAPEPDPDHVANACRAALQAAAASNRLCERWAARGRATFRTRFGLHTGRAVVGNVGASERINYTLVGPVANQASRLEGLNKVYGTEILASGEVVQLTADRFLWRHIDRIVAAGTTEAHDIYEPLGEEGDAVRHSGFLAQWRCSHAAYDAGRFEEALAGFRAISAMRPDDGPSRVFIDRCTAFLRDGMPPGWDGAWHFDRK